MNAAKVKIDDQQFALISRALADPKRFHMLQKIGQATTTTTCTCVCEWTGLAPATVSHHLKELDEAGLVQIERSGKFAYITLRRDIWTAYLKRLSEL